MTSSIQQDLSMQFSYKACINQKERPNAKCLLFNTSFVWRQNSLTDLVPPWDQNSKDVIWDEVTEANNLNKSMQNIIKQEDIFAWVHCGFI